MATSTLTTTQQGVPGPYLDDQYPSWGELAEKLEAPQPTTDQYIQRLSESLRQWDEVYPEILNDSQGWPVKATEERLRVAVRNEMRARGHELPEIVRWLLRDRIGFRSEEE